MEKDGRAGQATDDKCRMRLARWITKATDTHTQKYLVLNAFSKVAMVTERLNVTLYVIACLVHYSFAYIVQNLFIFL